MRKATIVAAALIAVLALSVGALAYPVVVGSHPLSLFHTGTPATVTHPKTGDDNSTGNETNGNETADNETAPVPPAPEANETENETGNGTDVANVTVDENVTEVHVDNTTYINGTIVVVQNGTDLADFTFQIVSYDNGTVNVVINGTQVVGSETVAIHGFAWYSPTEHTVDVTGTAAATSNGTVLWQRAFTFEAIPSYGRV